MTLNPRKQYQPYLAEDQSFDQIQMVDMKAINNKGAHYVKFQDEDNQNYNPYNNIKGNSVPQKTFADKPVVPNASYNFQPNKIVMNGLTFVHKDAIKGQMRNNEKPKKPEMQVVCEKCYTAQTVPGNTHSFICFKCDLQQGCQPQYGIFICGSCQRKVWYLHGISDFIKCTKCGTINNIPKETYPGGRIKNNPSIEQELSEISQNDIQPGQQDLSQKYFTKRHPQMYP